MAASLLGLLLAGCIREGPPEVFYTEEELLISAYLEEHADDYSTLLTVLEITDIKPILNAYGHYTFFAPDNQAFDRFCQENDCQTVEDLGTEYLVNLVKYHLLDVEMETSFLPNGVLPDTTYSGDNLVFTFEEGGIQSILINGYSTITERDIKVENGLIHRIDRVLKPVTLSMYDQLYQQDQYGIFTEALALTGLDDTLKVINISLSKDLAIKGRFTLFIESDSVFQAAGINSLSDLVERYSDSPDPSDWHNGLFRFMAYHCVPGVFFLNNLDSFNYPTLAPNSLINVEIMDEFYLNRHMVIQDNDTLDTYVRVVKNESNKAVKNGVYHSIDGLLEMWEPMPVFIRFELSDYQGIDINEQYDEEEIKLIKGISTENTGLWYRMSILDEDSSYLQTTSESIGWIVEFELPVMSKGIYRVMLHWVSAQNMATSVQAFWDDKMLGEEFSIKRQKRPPRRPPEWLYEFRVNHELGVVNLMETEGHTIKLVCLSGGPGVFDYITFWPE